MCSYEKLILLHRQSRLSAFFDHRLLRHNSLAPQRSLFLLSDTGSLNCSHRQPFYPYQGRQHLVSKNLFGCLTLLFQVNTGACVECLRRYELSLVFYEKVIENICLCNLAPTTQAVVELSICPERKRFIKAH